MFKDLTVSYLTGIAKVADDPSGDATKVMLRAPRTSSQMFFQPYESSEEFLFCVKNTLLGVAMLSIALWEPILAIIIPALMIGVTIVYVALAGVSHFFESSVVLEWTEYLVSELYQAAINMAVAPLAAVIMLTRVASTGLQAAGIYDADKALEPASSPALSS